MTSVSRHERISGQLVDLKMPGALEALDGVIRRVDSGSLSGSEAMRAVAGSTDHATEQPSSGGGHAVEPSAGGEDTGGLRLHVPALAAPGTDRLAARAGLPPAEGERGVPWSSRSGEDASGDQPGDPGGGAGPAGVLRVPERFGRVPPPSRRRRRRASCGAGYGS